ncbi:beta-1 adrenergic receptor-like [Portunus trituberculatus]|uniref:beta-1 adrenergic receptor-like n=1 Tax=Portunus trituberculatus TaxID=210409 RepID=UPI001E1D06D6|nr:beta-1 adrenergic receptor-like [Portunus trituberculatus]
MCITDNTTDLGEHSDKYCDHGIIAVATLSFFLAVSMFLAFFGNIMVILTILRHPGMRTRTNLLLGNLAVADILVAVLDMPVALTTIIKHDWIFSEELCYVNGFAVGLGLMLSIHTLMWISIHKYLSITRHFTCNVTKCKIRLMMVAAWAWTILYNLSATPLIGLTKTVYKKGSSQCGPAVPTSALQRAHSAINTLCNLVIPMGVMIFCYYKIFKEVHNHLERMREIADQGVRNSYIQQKQITVTLLIVLIFFFAFWMPYIVYSMSLVFLGEERVDPVFNPISYLFGYMNSACNPVIYAFRSPSFRRSFKEIICGSSSHLRGPRDSILISFRRSIFRTSERGQTYQPTASVHKTRPPRRASQPHTTHLLPHNTPKEANGTAVTVASPKNTPKLGPSVSVTFKGDSDTQLDTQIDTHSCTVDIDKYYPEWQPLQLQFPSNHLSRSCQEIIKATSSIMNRSVSAGDIPSLAGDNKQAQEKAEVAADVASKRRHRSEVHRPLMWQASVDHLTPVGRRRSEAMGRERVRAGQPQTQTQTHLRVRTMIRNFRRSLSDLFSIEEH